MASTSARSSARRVRLGVFFFLCVALPFAGTQAQPTPSLSGCQVCATSGDCADAYLNGPGQYCGLWVDAQKQKQRCCCPRDATCQLSHDACRCSSVTAMPAPPAPMSTGGWIGIAVGVAVFLSCLVGVGWCCVRGAVHQRRQDAAAPATAPNVGAVPPTLPYAMAVPAYNPPMYAPSAPVYDDGMDDGYSGYRHRPQYGHHDTGLLTGLGAVAGLATGMVIADIATDGGYSAYDNGSGVYDTGAGMRGFNGGGGISGGSAACRNDF